MKKFKVEYDYTVLPVKTIEQYHKVQKHAIDIIEASTFQEARQKVRNMNYARITNIVVTEAPEDGGK